MQCDGFSTNSAGSKWYPIHVESVRVGNRLRFDAAEYVFVNLSLRKRDSIMLRLIVSDIQYDESC